MKKIYKVNQTLMLLITRAKDKKKYPLDLLLSQYGIKSPLVSIFGFILFATIKIFLWGAACETPIYFLLEKCPNIVISLFGTFAAILCTELFIKKYFYPNLYDLISILPMSIFKQVFFKYSFELLGYRLIFIVLDQIILIIFLHFYYPNLLINTYVTYLLFIFFTHYLTFVSFVLFLNYLTKSFRFTLKTVTTVNNYLFMILIAVAAGLSGEQKLFEKGLNLSIIQIFSFSFVFIVMNILLCLFLEYFFDKNLYNDDIN